MEEKGVLRSAMTTPPAHMRCIRNDGKKWQCSRRRLHDNQYCEQHFRYFNQMKLRRMKNKEEDDEEEEEVGIRESDEEIPLSVWLRNSEESEEEDDEKMPLSRWRKKFGKNEKNLDEKCDLVDDKEIKDEDEGVHESPKKKKFEVEKEEENEEEGGEQIPLSTWMNYLKKKSSSKSDQEKCDLDAAHGRETESEVIPTEIEKRRNVNDEAKKVKNSKSICANIAMEANLMTILDPSGIKEERDLHDDQLAFLEAVRASSLVSDCGIAPTRTIYEAIFEMLKDGSSLELTMASYQILTELDKHFPRVKLLQSDTVDQSCNRTMELVVVEQAWSPFSFDPASVDSKMEARHRNRGVPLDSSVSCSLCVEDFSHLTKSIAHELDEVNHQVSGMKLVRDMMLFQYLVHVLEQDFVSRNTVYKENKSWPLLQESILNMLLGSRKISYKGLMRDCVSILSKECYPDAGVTFNKLGNIGLSDKTINDCNAPLDVAYLEWKERTYVAMQKFLTLIMELDTIKNEAGSQSRISRSDGVRTPLLEIIVDELTYHEEFFSRFLQVFSDPKWKLEIILQYISKYTAKPSVCTQRSSSSSEDITLDGVLSCFSSDTSTKRIIKKFSTGVAQLLLAHAFQAYLTLHNKKHRADSSENARGSSIVQICEDVIAAFHRLRGADKNMEITPVARGALFTAATVSMKYKVSDRKQEHSIRKNVLP